MSKCKCDLRTALVGDGCDVCNPAQALKYARENLAEAEALIDRCQHQLRQGNPVYTGTTLAKDLLDYFCVSQRVRGSSVTGEGRTCPRCGAAGSPPAYRCVKPDCPWQEKREIRTRGVLTGN